MAKAIKLAANGGITLTADQMAQFQAFLAAGGTAASVVKAKRGLTFKRYVPSADGKSSAEAPATQQDFINAVKTGKDAGAVYAHASCAKRAVSAASIREILSAIGGSVA